MTVDKTVIESLVEDESSTGIFDSEAVSEIQNTETPPLFFSEEWHDYVMRQFTEDELESGNPIRDGLQRVAEKLIGPIISRQIVNFTPASQDNRGETIVHIRYTFCVNNVNHPLVGERIIEDGIANVNTNNTPAPFHLHQPGSAASKAEAQALRKALRLKRVVSADEVTSEEALGYSPFLPDTVITEEHVNILDMLCRRVNISVLDLINCGDTKYTYIEQVPGSKAQQMIKYLSEIQSGAKQSVVKNAYDPAWREKNAKRRNPHEG